MADSPTILGEGVVEIEVLSEGSAIAATMNVRSATVRRSFNKIPIAILIIEDGDMAKQTFEHADSSTFKPGAKITISGSYKQVKQKIFTGIVIKPVSYTHLTLPTKA